MNIGGTCPPCPIGIDASGNNSSIATGMAAWLSGSTLIFINKVALCRVWLVLGWVTHLL